MKVRSLIYFIFFLTTFSCLTAQEDSKEFFLDQASTAIAKARKEMLTHKKNDMNGRLAKAMLLQYYAINLYKKDKSSNKFMCSSAAAWNYAIEIIKDIDGKVSSGYLMTEKEQKLLNSCMSKEELLLESKKNATNFSETEEDYLNPD